MFKNLHKKRRYAPSTICQVVTPIYDLEPYYYG